MNFTKKDALVIFLYLALIAVQFWAIDLLKWPETSLMALRLAVIFINAFIILYAYRGVLSADWRDFRARKWTKWLFILGTFAVVYCFLALIRHFLAGGEKIVEEGAAALEAADPDASKIPLILTLLVTLVPLLSSVTEEIVFRYLFMFKHSGRVLRGVLWVLSSVAFGLIHYQALGSVAASIPYIFAGLAFGGLYLWKKNIWYNIFAHMLFNGINVAMSLFGLILTQFAS
jgi:membrane protease YdiL (CAAX protease family)